MLFLQCRALQISADVLCLSCFIKNKKKTDAFDLLATANSVVTFIETFMVQWETNSSCFLIFFVWLFLFIKFIVLGEAVIADDKSSHQLL